MVSKKILIFSSLLFAILLFSSPLVFACIPGIHFSLEQRVSQADTFESIISNGSFSSEEEFLRFDFPNVFVGDFYTDNLVSCSFSQEEIDYMKELIIDEKKIYIQSDEEFLEFEKIQDKNKRKAHRFKYLGVFSWLTCDNYFSYTEIVERMPPFTFTQTRSVSFFMKRLKRCQRFLVDSC